MKSSSSSITDWLLAPGRNFLAHVQFLTTTLLLCSILVSPSLANLDFSCDSISVPKCFCESKSDRSGNAGLELLCPNTFVEVHNLTLVANVLEPRPATGGAAAGESAGAGAGAAGQQKLVALLAQCNPYEFNGEMDWELLKGLNFSNAAAIGYKFKLKISSCQIFQQDTLANFLEFIGVPKQAVVSFNFEPQLSRNAPRVKSSLLFSFISTLTSLETLELKRNTLVDLPVDLLTSLPALKELHLAQNNISTLHPALFQGNAQLSLLDLSVNQLKSIEEVQFPGSLKLLDLRGNQLQELSHGPLENLTSLEILTLRSNPLVTIAPNAFQSLTSLQILDLDYTQFKGLPALEGLTSLQKLSISYRDLDTATAFLGNHTQLNQAIYGEFSSSHELSLKFSANFESAFANLAPGLQSLLLIADGLIRIPKFGHLVNLTVLNLRANHIRELPADSFQTLPSLDSVDLSLNQLVSLDGFGAGNVLGNLHKLDFSHNFITSLGKDVFRKVSGLESLKLRNNLISSVDPKAFEALSKLKELDLSQNQLSSLSSLPRSSSAPSSSAADQHEMDFLFQSGFDQSVLRNCREMESLNLARNQLTMIYDDWKLLMAKLRVLDLSFNALQEIIPSDLDFFTKSPMTLDLTSNNITIIHMEHALLMLESSTTRSLVVKLGGNPLICDCRLYSLVKYQPDLQVKGIRFDTSRLSCASPPQLANVPFHSIGQGDLYCSYDLFPDHGGCPSICSCYKIPYNATVVVDCSYKNLSEFIPSIDGIQLPRGYKIVLNLAGNQLTVISINHTKNISSDVVQLDLSKNKLESLSFLKLFPSHAHVESNEIPDSDSMGPPLGEAEAVVPMGPMAELNQSKSAAAAAAAAAKSQLLFSIAQNRFACDDCEFHRLIKHYYKQIHDYRFVTCLMVTEDNVTESRSLSVDQAAIETEFCSPEPPLALSGPLLGLAILAGILFTCTGILIILYVRHGWAIRAFLYSKGFASCFYINDDDEGEEEKLYDAFVSYSHKDEAWVISQLVSRLEDEHGFKLCLHYRDWTPGDWIPDQIVQSVDKSRRTVIILSKNFVESIWSRLEFKAAHSQALNEKTNRLILILIGEDLSDTDIYDEDLRMYMKMNTYLKWSDPWLWHKLKFALPHKKKSQSSAMLNKAQHERAIQLDKLRTKMELQSSSIT